MADEHCTPQAFLSPLLTCAGLGATLCAAFLLTGHGLGAFGFFRDLAAVTAQWDAPFWATENAYLSSFLSEDGLLSGWITWEIVGVALGSLAGFRLDAHLEGRGEGVVEAKHLAGEP